MGPIDAHGSWKPAIFRKVGKLKHLLGGLARHLAPPEFSLLEAVTSYWLPSSLVAVTKLGVPEQLKDGARDVGEIARALGLHEDSLYRVLRALAREGFLVEAPARSFALTALSRPLLADAPNSMRHMVLNAGAEWSQRVWGSLAHSIKTGDDAFTHIYQQSFWQYLAEHPEDGEHFHGAMLDHTMRVADVIAASHDFSAYSSIVDVGGGAGHLVGAILARYPKLRGTVFDVPQVHERAPATLARLGVGARCEVVAGDMFERVPEGNDVYVLKNIVHGLSDADAEKVLTTCRRAMTDKGTMLLVESVVPDRGPYLQFLDLQMLINTNGGRERTREEFERLFARAGFRLTAVVENPSPVALLVAEKA